MLDREIETFLASAKDEEVIDGVIEVLQLAQKLLSLQQKPENRDFCSGLASNEVSHASKVLAAYRQKKYGDKSATVL